jgi:hypothetical protein
MFHFWGSRKSREKFTIFLGPEKLCFSRIMIFDNYLNLTIVFSFMVKDSKKELTKSEKIERGQVYIRAIIEVLGKPKDYVRETVKELLKNLKESDSYEVKK